MTRYKAGPDGPAFFNEEVFMGIQILNLSGIYEQESFYKDYPGAEVVDLKDITGTNCMCDDAAAKEILQRVEDVERGSGNSGAHHLPYGLHFVDNGNYHYMSALLSSRVKEPFSLVVLDHHPDMQRPMFDILSCGGWVTEVLDKNPFVRDVHIIGADKKLIEELDPDDRAKAHFYDLEDIFGGGNEVNLPKTEFPVYLSIDKDVLHKDELETNWDQGDMTTEQLLLFVGSLLTNEKKVHDRDLLAIDICGECAPDQEDCDVEKAVAQNDAFNARIMVGLSLWR